MLADDELDVANLLRQKRIGELDLAGCEIELEFIAEVSRNRSLDAQPRAAHFVAKAKPRIVIISRTADIADIILKAPTRLEAPSAFAGQLRRAFPGRRRLHHRRLHLLDRFLEGFDLRLEELDLGLLSFDGGSARYLGVRGGIGRIRVLRFLLRLGHRLLRERRSCNEECSAAKQRRSELQLVHYFRPSFPASL